MNFRRMHAPRWLWSAAALMLVLVALSPIPAEARQYYTIKRVSVSSTGVQGINIQDPVVNANGSVIAFWSDREGLIPSDTNFAGDVFVHNRANNQTFRVSLGFGGVQTSRTDGNLPVSYPEIDIDNSGCSIVYSSDAHNITQQNSQQTPDVNNTTDVFLVNVCVGGFPNNNNQTLHISKNYATGQQANGGNTNPKINGAATVVLWRSGANNLVIGDTNNQPDIFLMELKEGAPISRVNISNTEAQANVEDGTMTFDVSDDGNIVVFGSIASNLVTGDTNGQPDIFIRNRLAGTTVRINGTGGVQPNGGSFNPSISGNGQHVAFRSEANNLVPGDTNGHGDVFVYNIATGEIVRASVSSEGTQGNFPSGRPSINSNGKFVSFYSDATTLVYGDTNGSGDIFLRDVELGITTRVSVRADSNASQASGPSGQISAISDNAQVIAWESFQANIVPNDTNATSDVFVSEAGPRSPNSLTVTNRTVSSVSLTWVNTNASFEKVVVQRRAEGNANFAVRQTLNGNVETFTDSSLAACTVYFYRVLSRVDGRESPSNIVRAKTLGCPPGPFNLTAPVNDRLIINPARADFRWTASEEATTYTFTLNRTGVGQVEQRTLNAVDICDTAQCILPMDGALLGDLTDADYTWTVTASNPVCAAPPAGVTCPTAANNNPQSFTVNRNLPPRGFRLLTPEDNTLIRDLDSFDGFEWRDNEDAVEYALTVVQVSNNTRLGTVIDHQNLTPQSDGDGLSCDFVARTCTYAPTSGELSALANGTFTWTVFAESPGGQRSEVNNGAWRIRINTGDIELLTNRGLEADTDNNKIPDGWRLSNPTAEKLQCNKPSVTYTPYGNCAFQFRGSAGENSTLLQNITDSGYGMGNGDFIRLQSKGEATNLPGNVVQIMVIVKYKNNAFPKDKATANVPAGTYGFSVLPTLDLGIDGPVQKITVRVLNQATSGKLMVDDFSLLLLGPDTPRSPLNAADIQYYPNTRIPLDAARDGSDPLLPPPPPAIDGFRGQN